MSVVKKNKLPKFRAKPTSEEEYRKLADELVQWAHLPDSLIINNFPLSITMSPQIFHKLAVDSEYFSQAYDIALHTIGSRRERLAQEGIIDKQIFLQTMPLYDINYRKWLMALRDKTENKGETKVIVVHMPAFASTDEVPERKITE
ncbi:MAG: hypothetical protein K2X90_00200 [Candidatus Babeliaceae bacterium]|nr:hypothetical protein [Candidatus Babeliaceae bacterium]